MGSNGFTGFESGQKGLHQVLRGFEWIQRVWTGSLQPYRVLLGLTGFHRVRKGFMGSGWLFLGIAGFYRVPGVKRQ